MKYPSTIKEKKKMRIYIPPNAVKEREGMEKNVSHFDIISNPKYWNFRLKPGYYKISELRKII